MDLLVLVLVLYCIVLEWNGMEWILLIWELSGGLVIRITGAIETAQ